MLCLLGVILILVAVYLSANRNFDQLFNCLILVVILLAGAVLGQSKTNENFLGSAPVDYKMGKCDSKVLTADDAITKYYNTSWEGHRLQHKRNDQEIPLIKKPIIYSPIGDGYELGTDPTLDRKMSFLAHNYASPACCPSVYSTDTGCVCMTKDQEKMLVGRGGNAGYD